ncbi:MAG TPA: hypothetical protein PK385_01805 [Spirochaetota bacterium]|nr:hypothetical protein [Spirochaetota bacterium]HOS31585.1 hypothetical protein [Spirochaetota bacterium]HOS54772.1 hypothetical protein [Spirochaetota bacterium]HPK61913.1 hypothetical protein [Spirochaetota bacterium]HQF77426.1 hypothetical protein [Spirochaetota bacterium]
MWRNKIDTYDAIPAVPILDKNFDTYGAICVAIKAGIPVLNILKY